MNLHEKQGILMLFPTLTEKRESRVCVWAFLYQKMIDYFMGTLFTMYKGTKILFTNIILNSVP